MTKYTNGTRKEEREKLVNAHKKLRNVTYGLIALLVVALITAILKTMIPSLACLAVMVLLRFTVHRTAREEYRQAMTDAALTCSVGAKLDEFELKEKGGTGITREEIRETKMLPIKGGGKLPEHGSQPRMKAAGVFRRVFRLMRGGIYKMVK